MNYNESIHDAHDIWTRIKNKFDESKHDSSFDALLPLVLVKITL